MHSAQHFHIGSYYQHWYRQLRYIMTGLTLHRLIVLPVFIYSVLYRIVCFSQLDHRQLDSVDFNIFICSGIYIAIRASYDIVASKWPLSFFDYNILHSNVKLFYVYCLIIARWPPHLI
jgi:hypothetical protein